MCQYFSFKLCLEALERVLLFTELLISFVLQRRVSIAIQLPKIAMVQCQDDIFYNSCRFGFEEGESDSSKRLNQEADRLPPIRCAEKRLQIE